MHLSEALSLERLKRISRIMHAAAGEQGTTFHNVITTDAPGILAYYTDGFENTTTVDNFTAATV